jgi:diguanylate cyclase (GGDEF)-like protein/PAS domain S-box-containing protein
VLELEELHRQSMSDAGPIIIHTTKSPIYNDAGQVIGIQGVFEDITERKRMEEELRDSEARYRVLFEANPHPMWVYDPDSLALLAVNAAAVAHYGYSSDEFLAMTVVDLCSPGEGPEISNDVAALPQVVSEQKGPRRHRKKDGTVIDVELTANTITFAGRLVNVALAQDVTARRKSEEQLEYQASHDTLTGLPNRALLRHQIERTIATAKSAETSAALLLLDLDRFKEINDTFGHHYGDIVLQQLNPRLRRVVRKLDVVARLGGDEFGILLPEAQEAGATAVAEKILEALREPILVDGHRFDVGASIGIALFPEHAQDVTTLLQCADVAMYAAKRAHAGHLVYSARQSGYNPRRLRLIAELRDGLEADQLLLQYQPKIDLGTMRAAGAEALIRWHHPHEGLLAPSQFIGLAEQTGLIRPLGMWALKKALSQCAAWHKSGLNLDIAVNLPAASLQDEHVIETILRAVEQSDLMPSWLTVEITESAMMADPTSARDILGCLHGMGVKISIDDFGTGYSSLAYLKELPVDEVKVDRSFVKDMLINEHDTNIVRSVIDLGHNLGLLVVAEGVEDRQTLDLLAAMGCDLAQGFYFASPMSSNELARWLESPRRSWPEPALRVFSA